MNHYDAVVAKAYEDDRRHEEHWQLENQYISMQSMQFEGARVLDVPVGTGRFLTYYDQVGVDEVVGLDISLPMLEEAKSKEMISSRLTIKVGDAFSIDYPDDYFDYVVCFRLMHLVPQEQRSQLLSELMRVGRVVLLQIYQNKKIYFVDKIISKVLSMFRSSTPLPWGSIPSYPLFDVDLNDIVVKSGARILSCDKLCEYSGSNVFVLRIVKS